MRIVYFGTPEFSVIPLEVLAGSHEVVAVVTRPDAASGRGSRLLPSPVAERAGELGIPVIKANSLAGDGALSYLERTAPDAAVVVAFGRIIPACMLTVPRYGFVNVHASLLPRWRGAAPVQRAVLAGDEFSGVSIMRVEEGLDTGPYCLQTAVPARGKSALDLFDELACSGAGLLLEALAQIEAGTATWTDQDPALATYAEKISKADVALSPALHSGQNVRRVLAATGSAPAHAIVCGRPMVVSSARESKASAGPGEVAGGRKRLVLGCVEGAFEALSVRPDGKREMSAAAFLAGLKGNAPRTWWGVTR